MSGLADSIAAADIQLLQLDYSRRLAIESGGPAELNGAEFAPAFAAQAKSLARHFYLGEELTVVTSAGWNNALVCVEEAAAQLCETGNHTLPMSAVRGCNLLPILDYLVADGIDLAHEKTGIPLKELRQPILAAELEIGGGPIAAAMADSARVIVAGCYDSAAPLCAASVTRYGWSWRDYPKLARAAAAADAAVWPARLQTSIASIPTCVATGWVEFDDSQSSKIRMSHPFFESAVGSLQEWLRRRKPEGVSQRHSDLNCDYSTMVCVRDGEFDINIQGAQGTASDDLWRINIYYDAGFAADAILAVDAARLGCNPEQFTEFVRGLLGSVSDPQTHVQVTGLDANAEGRVYVATSCQSPGQGQCEQFVDDVMSLAASHHDAVSILSGPLRVRSCAEIWPTHVARDAVDIAVDTRLASDWV